MSKKLKVGIIGCGGIANQKHMPALKALSDDCETVAFCDIIESRAVKAAEEFGVPGARVYTDYRDLLKEDEIDVVHVLTPNVSHCPITVAAFEAGKHVMCEKPMAHNTEAAEKMLEAWRRSGKKFTIGYQNRFRPEVQALYRSCQSGELGDIYFAKAHAVRRRAVPTWGVFQNKEAQGGGPLIDIGTHALDLTLWMMDNYEVESVSGSVFYKMADQVEGNLWGPWDPATYEVEDSAFGFVKMKNGATIFLEASWVLNVVESREASTTLCGTKAGAELRSGMSYPRPELIFNRVLHGIPTEERNSYVGGVAYFGGDSAGEGVAEARQWINAVKNDTEPLVSPEQAFVVTRILDAIYQSHLQGREIRF
jgi:predicted dehydrogenase